MSTQLVGEPSLEGVVGVKPKALQNTKQKAFGSNVDSDCDKLAFHDF